MSNDQLEEDPVTNANNFEKLDDGKLKLEENLEIYYYDDIEPKETSSDKFQKVKTTKNY